jgi:hypothetical protein
MEYCIARQKNVDKALVAGTLKIKISVNEE